MRTLAGSIPLAALTLAFASVASAATISIRSDKPGYDPGETITITIDLTVEQGETAPDAALTLRYDSTSVSSASVDANVATLTSFGGTAWSTSALQGQCDQPELCRVVGQLGPNPSGSPADAYTSQAVLTFRMEVGSVFPVFDFAVANFFGATAPSLTVMLLPEPGTAALVFTGLGALGWRRRARPACR